MASSTGGCGGSSEDGEWRCLGDAALLKRSKCRHVYSARGKNHDLVLLFVNGKFYAMEAWCSHQGGPLYEGDIEDYKGKPHLMCPWHAFMFDVESGKNEIGLVQETFQAKADNGKVYVKHKWDLSLEPFTKKI